MWLQKELRRMRHRRRVVAIRSAEKEENGYRKN